MAHDVFISYSSRDKNTADAVCAALERNKIRCWIASRDVTPGKEWGEEIVQAISNSQVMVLVFSSAANRSQQVLREVERAVNKNVIIVPFRIEDVLPTRSMEYFLYSTHWLDALTPDLERHIGRLVDTVAKLLSSPEQQVMAVPPAGSRRFPPRRLNQTIRYACFTVLVLLALFGLSKILNIQVQFNPGQNDHSLQTGSGSGGSKGSEELGAEAKPGPGKPLQNGDTAAETQVVGSGASTDDHKATELKIGDYIRFGKYNGEAVEWRIINIDDQGKPLLLSSKVIGIKPFDAAEGGTYNLSRSGRKVDNLSFLSELIARYPMDELRQMKGNNNWIAANIREWLNSADRRVHYSTAPPLPGAVADEEDAYDQEPGFLSNFNEYERRLIKPVSRPALLPDLEKEKAEGGTHVYSFSMGPTRKAMAGYEQAYYRNITDKVFLLTTQDVFENVVNRGWDLRAEPTQKIRERYSIKSKYYGWWLMTPEASTSFRVFSVNSEPDLITHSNAANSRGIRPALFLNASKLILSGSGTEADPYYMR